MIFYLYLYRINRSWIRFMKPRTLAFNVYELSEPPKTDGVTGVIVMECLLETHAREKGKLPPDWEFYKWRSMPESRQYLEPCLYHEITGAVAPIKTKGKNKGRRDWDKMDKATKRVIVITPEEHETWLQEWERKTGKCNRCVGEGQTVKSFGVGGTTYRECATCKGSGKSLQAA